MIRLRRAADRGHANHGWLDSHHTFSFADYYDPRHMGFGPLRVINEDRVAPGMGFGAHPHRDMEIVSYVLEGGLAHRDSMGNGSTVRAGDVQCMSAGTGVRHSEFNASTTEPVHFLQIWLLPNALALKPGYQQKHFARSDKLGRFRLVASADGADESLVLHSDARIYAGVFEPGQRGRLPLAEDRRAWIQILHGSVRLGDHELVAGDGAALTDEAAVVVDAVADSELLVFDLA